MIQQISIKPNYPNQITNFTANYQNITLNLFWVGYSKNPENQQEYINYYCNPRFYANIFVNNVEIVTSKPVVDKTPINVYPTTFSGYIVAYNKTGNIDPTLENIGVTVFLYYIDNLNELENIK